MGQRVIGVLVTIFRFVSDEPQPGLVQFDFVDVNCRRWIFTEKTAMVSAEYINGDSEYPRPGTLGCQVMGVRPHASGGQSVEISIDFFPDCVDESGTSEISMNFEVRPELLVESDWDIGIETPWDGRP